MENIASALKMAAAVLIFILAIASAFSIFGQAKKTADAIINMRDRQKYLETAEVDYGVLYTSYQAIGSDTGVAGITANGDRLVEMSDVFSTIQRYSKEKYGVTIMKKNGEVIARFDSNTENLMRQYNKIESGLEEYVNKIKENITTCYATPDLNKQNLCNLYKVKVQGNAGVQYGAPWYGNNAEIQKRINADIAGTNYIDSTGKITYKGKKLKQKLENKKIVEVTNEIDRSVYLTENDENGNVETHLLQQYEMPTVEIVYIII